MIFEKNTVFWEQFEEILGTKEVAETANWFKFGTITLILDKNSVKKIPIIKFVVLKIRNNE